jgi:hypothetical protein
MNMTDTSSMLRVVCAWCNEILKEGRGPEKDQISHGCCCECKVKYFPTLADASKCQMELIERDHERAYRGASPVSDICHVDLLVCKNCGFEDKPELYPCDCG